MIYGYIQVSTDKQTTENQRFAILKFAHEKKLSIGRWIEETVSSTRKLSDRKLGALLERMHEDDILIVTELSRLGRSLLARIIHQPEKSTREGDFVVQMNPKTTVS
jgi:DNA invertase Pin-like site-specific DNA recombinase